MEVLTMRLFGRGFKITILVVIIICGFLISTRMYGEPASLESSSSTISQLYLFNTILSYIRAGYVEEVDTRLLIEGAIRGMLSELDPHTIYMSPDEYGELRVDTVGKFGGLGIEITITPEDETLTVIAPIEGTPAYYAGIEPRDKIIKIDGESTEGITLMQAVNKMRGEPGTDCTLTIRRLGEDEEVDVKITRAIIDVKSVRYAYIIEPGIAYVRLARFSEDTAIELLSALRKLKAQGMKGCILDLRGNPGGLLDLAVDVTGIFVPEGKLVVYTQSERKSGREKEFKSAGGIHRPDGDIEESEFTKLPLVVLVDEASASGSEIVAGAIQDLGRGLVIGGKTFGKASVQTIIPLDVEGSDKPAALKMTVAYYYTPKGTLINEKGITPDVELEYSKYSPLVSKMSYKGLFRIYAERLYAEERENALNVFENNHHFISEMMDLMRESDFHFYSEAEEETLPENGWGFVRAEMEKNADDIYKLLKRELLRLVEGEESAFKFMIERDDWVKRALEELRGEMW
ncbi:MAG: hypothetical protein DRH44_01795 [Candidatus Coatesbacteria bacterium]|nr:MAG: hypothetical protein DRH44_01795 [Candidatus Coatesbacteria bacterium]